MFIPCIKVGNGVTAPSDSNRFRQAREKNSPLPLGFCLFTPTAKKGPEEGGKYVSSLGSLVSRKDHSNLADSKLETPNPKLPCSLRNDLHRRAAFHSLEVRAQLGQRGIG